MSNDNNNNGNDKEKDDDLSLIMDSVLSQDTINKMAEIGRIGISMNELLASSAKTLSEAIVPVVNINQQIKPIMDEFRKSITPVININNQIKPFMNEFKKSMTPLFNYIEENRDRLNNFSNSYEELIEHYMKINNIDENSATELIEKLFNEGKIILNDDWIFEIVESNVPESKVNKSKKTLEKILIVSYEFIKFYNNIIGMQDNIDTIADLTNEQEQFEISDTLHYNTQVLPLIANRYSVINNTKLYTDSSYDSEAIAELKVDDVVIYNKTKDDWILVVLTKDDNEDILGWVKTEDITPLIDIGN